MSFDPSVESPIPLTQAPKLPWLPGRRAGKRLHQSTFFRWCGRGVRGVRLEVLWVGGRLCTSEAALKRFFAALSATDPRCTSGDPAPPPSRTAAARADRHAKRELAKAGINC